MKGKINWDRVHRYADACQNTIKRQPAPMLPGMGAPVFGGVQLRPGMDSRRPYTGPQPSLFARIPSDDGQESLTEITKPPTKNHNETIIG